MSERVLVLSKIKRTPLYGSEDGGFERLRKPGVHRPGLLLLTLNGLEIVKAAFSCHFALKLFQSIEGHASGIGAVKQK